MKNDIPAAILVVSFGTTHPDTLERCIAATEQAIAARFPEHPVYRAFTSGMVIRCLKEKRGIAVDTVKEALARIAEDGFTRVAVQPTLILSGIEYEKIQRNLADTPNMRVALGRPLIGETEDCAEIAAVLMQENPLAPDEALMLMGHGTEHAANDVYHAMQAEFDREGYRAFIGTVEGTPSFADSVARLTASGASRARLLPLMFVAGDHAKNDMAGAGEDSLISLVNRAGIEAEPVLRGLGESKTIQSLYAARVEETLREVMA